MKLKHDTVIREIAGQHVVIPAGDMDMNAMITLNETGAFLWKLMEDETNESVLTAALLAEYDVDEATAQKAVAAFVQKLKDHDFLV